MLDIGVEAFGIATLPYTAYLPPSELEEITVGPVRCERESRGIPVEHRMVVAGNDRVDLAGEPDVAALALAALGAPARAETLFLVRGALRDALVTGLAGLVHAAGWVGDDLGITHLEELGGTVAFQLVDWAMPAELGATVLICDEPLVADARAGGALFAAVSLRVRPGDGPLRILECGEGEPGGAAVNGVAHRFGGTGPCDGWLALHEALSAGRIGDGERVLIQVSTPLHQGWLLLQAAAVAQLRLATGAVAEAA